MRSPIIAGTFRRRGLILGAAIVASIAWFLISGQAEWRIWEMVPFVALLAGLAWGAWSRRRRPEAFVVDSGTPAFGTGLSSADVYWAFAMLLVEANLAARERSSWVSGPGWFAAAVSLWCLGVLVAALVLLRFQGVQLRPAGLVVSRLFGTLIVPWEALAPGYPVPMPAKADSMPLTYVRPELVRHRGLTIGRRWVHIPEIHAGFLAAAIRYYVAHPQDRAAIGTETEHDRLLRALTARPPSEHET
ncbi:hypothetical protein [Planosporangium mesophilum]|uniref:Uncharacterized protein n=1 Tax=Planosporangium mesophilum TaxID=689768 RepID=A0A8J3TET9_9ACTN|nr:hypothetical protein [Planosporangium mesophilum]NJC86448.1 hypothetical protein [Planosporangium mesophilum]GII25153.1 hypothetical protein Pme01_47500 [Planosporangium mesophilum]